ncbi:Pyruvate kinase [Phytophthora fragariae]|nr:Pyruvate kinase [Phytophthora fragariae]
MSDRARRAVVPRFIKLMLPTTQCRGDAMRLTLASAKRYTSMNLAPQRLGDSCVIFSKRVLRLGKLLNRHSSCSVCSGCVCSSCKVEKNVRLVSSDMKVTRRRLVFCSPSPCLGNAMAQNDPELSLRDNAGGVARFYRADYNSVSSRLTASGPVSSSMTWQKQLYPTTPYLKHQLCWSEPKHQRQAAPHVSNGSHRHKSRTLLVDRPSSSPAPPPLYPPVMLRRLALRSVQTTLRNARGLASASELWKNPRSSKFSMTKIVGTIGPVSEQLDMLQKLTNEGLRIMRINFSHAEYDEALLRVNNLRACRGVHAEGQAKFNLRAVLHDTKGPEIRTGKMLDGKKIRLEKGKSVVLTTDPAFEVQGTADKFYVTYQQLAETVKVGDTVLLSDGLIRLTCTAVGKGEITCEVENTEEIGNRKGVNLPGLIVELPALSEKDKRDLDWGVEHDIDFIAASFIRKASDVHEIRAFVAECIKKHWAHEPKYIAPKIISKVENLEGVQNFEEILEASDGIMCARGDLGVEVPAQKVLTYQKMMVDRCNAVGKPVIVATQMLESMQNNPRPTRAEVSDVGNAVLDGADCVMLSGESAQGKYPIESVATMNTVIKEADELLLHPTYRAKFQFDPPTSDVESAVSSAVKTANEMNAQLMIVLTATGYTARKVAKYKPTVPVMCFTTNLKVGRQLQIHRGLYPVVPDYLERRPTTAEAIAHAKKMGWLSSGDRVVVISGDKLSDDLGREIVMGVADVQ